MANIADDDNMFDAVIACNSVYIACSAALLNLYAMASKRKRAHRVWISRYLLVRPQYGLYNNLMRDLLELDNTRFRNYIRMDPDVFELFASIEPLITVKDKIQV
jgi:hypothetical protein